MKILALILIFGPMELIMWSIPVAGLMEKPKDWTPFWALVTVHIMIISALVGGILLESTNGG